MPLGEKIAVQEFRANPPGEQFLQSRRGFRHQELHQLPLVDSPAGLQGPFEMLIGLAPGWAPRHDPGAEPGAGGFARTALGDHQDFKSAFACGNRGPQTRRPTPDNQHIAGQMFHRNPLAGQSLKSWSRFEPEPLQDSNHGAKPGDGCLEQVGPHNGRKP